MAHIQTNYLKLWKPQNLAVDKISSQKMFIDNINGLENFAISVLKRSSESVASLSELKAINTSDIAIYSTGTTIFVRSNGLYFFDRASTATDNGQTVIAPTAGGGRWISDQTFLGSLAFKNSLSATDVGLGNVPNVATNDQTPTYTQASTLIGLTSGEKMSVAFGKISKGITDLIAHIANKTNPHSVTATQVGLGNVDNTSDANKPVSTAQANAIADAKKAGTDTQINLTNHINTKSNPHSVTAAQVGLGNVPNVATNDQTPTYTEAATLATLTSGEKISTAFGKISKGIASLINHLSNTNNPHNVTAAQLGIDNNDDLIAHTSNTNNPHNVTAAQTGAIPKVSSPVVNNLPILASTGGIADSTIGVNEIDMLRHRGAITEIPSGASFDSYLTVGRYKVSTDAIATTLINKPSSYRGLLTVRNIFGTEKTFVVGASMVNAFFLQEYIDGLGIIYTRRLQVSYDDYHETYNLSTGVWFRVTSSGTANAMATAEEVTQ